MKATLAIDEILRMSGAEAAYELLLSLDVPNETTWVLMAAMVRVDSRVGHDKSAETKRLRQKPKKQQA